ncbi:hypothetical protein [Pedobacter soli]|uniref:ABC-2 family transporter protein n=1 Tax=Pedobacter soli TaxID=390242 RepID=A0A1G7ATY4_9SPHI|nr:hypothetical protein [Pedobacter soli]SDE18263.1 hypothetical protein SAMN04488024_11352 [Pedobacter soli]
MNYIRKMIALNRRQYLEHWQFYSLLAFAITGLLFLLFFITWHWQESFSGGVGNGIFLIGLFGGGAAFSAFLYQDLRHPAKTIWLLGIIASAGQKVMLWIIYAVFLYGVAYTIIFYLVEALFFSIVTASQSTMTKANVFSNGFYSFYLIFVNFQLWLMVGSLAFHKGALIKTLLLMVLYFIIAATGNVVLMKAMTGESSITSSLPFNYFQFIHDGENIYVYLPANLQALINVSYNFLLPLFLSYIAYLKFTEKEI